METSHVAAEKVFIYVYFVRLQGERVVQQLANRALNGATTATILEDRLPRALRNMPVPTTRTHSAAAHRPVQSVSAPGPTTATTSMSASTSSPVARSTTCSIRQRSSVALAGPAGGGSRRGTDSGHRTVTTRPWEPRKKHDLLSTSLARTVEPLAATRDGTTSSTASPRKRASRSSTPTLQCCQAAEHSSLTASIRMTQATRRWPRLSTPRTQVGDRGEAS